MNGTWVEAAAQLLGSDEREAVLGDLIEAGEGGWQGVLAVFGLVMRREAAVWKDWRPWLAAFGVALPASLLLMGLSVSVSWRLQHLESQPRPWSLVKIILLLAGSAWTGGFVVGWLSRRTLWASFIACGSPCLFCLVRFREPSLSRLCLLLFLLPAIGGVWQGLRGQRIRLNLALVLALAITALMAGKALPLINWALIWPVWYLVATAKMKAGAA